MTIEFISRIVKSLEKNQVEYVLTGGVAQLIRNEKKFTMDIDILVSQKPENIEKIEQFILEFSDTKINTKKNLSENKIIRLNVFPFSIDILPKLDGLSIQEVFNTSEAIQFNGFFIPTISKQNLIINYKYCLHEK